MKIRWHWGVGIGLTYGVFAAATLGFAVFAMEQRVQLVGDDYYARAMEQDRRSTAITNAAALGDTFSVETAPDGRTVTLTWPRDQRIDPGGTVRLYRPSDSAADRPAPAAPNAAHRQVVSLAGAPAGLWRLQVQWSSRDREFYIERAIEAR